MSLKDKYDVRRLRRLGCYLLAGVLAAGFIPWDQTITMKGFLQPEKVYPVIAPEDGYVAEIFVSAGESVEKGEVLLQIESDKIEKEKERLGEKLSLFNARREGAKITLEKEVEVLDQNILFYQTAIELRALEYESSKELFEQGSVSKEVLQEVWLELVKMRRLYQENIIQREFSDFAENFLEQEGIWFTESEVIEDLAMKAREVKNEEQLLTEQMRRRFVRALTEGILLSKDIANLKDHYVERGDVLLEIGEQGSIEMRGLAKQKMLAFIRPGQKADVKLWISSSSQLQIFPGTVIRVSPALQYDAENKDIFLVHIRLDDFFWDDFLVVMASAKAKIKVKRSNAYQHFFDWIERWF